MYTTSKDETEEERRRRLDAVVDAYDGPDAGEEEVLRGDPDYIPPVEVPTPAAPVSPREPDYSAAEDAIDEADRADRIERDREREWADRRSRPSGPMVPGPRPAPAPVDPANRAARAAMREAERREADRLGREATALYEEAPPGLSADLGRVYEMDPRFAPGPASGDIRALLADPVPRPDVPTAVDGGRHVAPGVKGGSLPKRGGDLPTTTGDAMAASVERGPLPIPEEVPSWEAGEVPTDTDPAREAAEFVRRLDLSGLEGGVSEALADASGYVAPHGEPDADEMGGPPDMDADDLGTTGAAMERSAERAAEVRPERARWEAVTDPWDESMDDSYAPSPLASAAVPQAEGDAETASAEWYGTGEEVPQSPGEMALAEGAVPYDRNPGTDDMDMGEWSRLPNDEEPASDMVMPEEDPEAALAAMEPGMVITPEEALADEMAYSPPEPDADEVGGPPDMDADDPSPIATDDLSDDEANTTGSEYLPIDISTEARDLLGVTGPRPGVDTDLVEPDWSDRGLMSEEDAFAGPPPSRDDETWGMATDEDPILPAAPIDREADAAAMDAKVPSGTSGPPADDFTGADWSDAIRGSIGGLLQALSGRGVTPVRSERDEMEERIAARDAAKGAATRAYEARESRSADRAADRASREAIAAERADIARTESERDYELGARRADTGALNADANRAATESLVATREADLEREDARNDPASEESARAMERLPAYTMGLPGDLRPAVEEYLSGREWSAADVERFERFSPSMWRSRLGRRGGGGAGGGARRAALVAEAQRVAGLDRSTAEAMPTAALVAEIRELSGAGAERGEDFVAGVPMSALTVDPGSPEARSVRHELSVYSGARAAVRELARLTESRSLVEMATDPNLNAEVAPLLAQIRGAATFLQNSGAMTESERRMIDRDIPDPTNFVGLGLGRYNEALNAWAEALEGRYYTGLSNLGVDPATAEEGIARMGAVRRRRADGGLVGREAPAAVVDEVSTEERYVTMRSPSGLEVEVPEDEVARFVSMGAEVVDGP